MITIIHYGLGNLFSLQSSLSFLGLESEITSDPAKIKQAQRLILPGVGGFPDAMERLEQTGLAKTIVQAAQASVPLLGICLGMQLLFESSMEYGLHQGLGLLPGTVRPLTERLPSNFKSPHMGWNQLHIVKEVPILENVAEGDFFYYVHSYYAAANNSVLAAVSDYGFSIPGVVGKRNVFGTQFHPEKSGKSGLCILKSFAQCRKEDF